ncbi:deubiquitinase OTUD6B-like [Halichondria panicea]|uniref:deubiquitinase OTUD6B-like n=1 Tax=Halichondria panicea TaxID=6063 RepID=UPI00312BCB90
MAECSAVETVDEREALQSNTRAEIKELRAKIQGLKKAVPKGDKKRKKEATAEITKLEEEFKKLENLKVTLDVPEDVASEETDVSSAQELLNAVSLDEKQEVGVGTGSKKKSKAQKRKEKKLQEEREREERIEIGETESALNNPRLIEREALSGILGPLGLAIKDVPADGHCLYAAVSDQLSCRVGIKASVSRLRAECSQYILTHSDEFLPYLVDPNTGDQFTQDTFLGYCEEIAHTAAWGGQLEIQALSHVYKVPVRVYQASAPVLTLGGEAYTDTTLTLAYHHHEYGLGEHYNSIVPNTLSS